MAGKTVEFDIVPLVTGPTVTTTSTLTSGSFVTSSNSPTLTFTPKISGKYRVYATPWTYNTNSSGYAFSRIFNTAGGAALISSNIGSVYGNTGDHGTSVRIEAVYQLIAGTSYSFDIQQGSNGGSTQIGDSTPIYITAEIVI
jgi:cold shock CspA family protein